MYKMDDITISNRVRPASGSMGYSGGPGSLILCILLIIIAIGVGVWLFRQPRCDTVHDTVHDFPRQPVVYQNQPRPKVPNTESKGFLGSITSLYTDSKLAVSPSKPPDHPKIHVNHKSKAASVAPGSTGPLYIIIIRHSENSDNIITQAGATITDANLTGTSPVKGLTRDGKIRATQLPDFVATIENKCSTPVSTIFITKGDRCALLSGSPIIFSNDLNVVSDYSVTDYQSLADSVMTNPAYQGQGILIIYNNSCIQSLVKAFGQYYPAVADYDVPIWEADNFARFYSIYKGIFTVGCQHLTVGDNTVCSRPFVYGDQVCTV